MSDEVESLQAEKKDTLVGRVVGSRMNVDALTVQRNDARRWAAAWKALAKAYRSRHIHWYRYKHGYYSAIEDLDDARRWARRMKAERDVWYQQSEIRGNLRDRAIAERDSLAAGVGEMQGYKLTGANDSDRPLIVSGQFEYRLPPVTLDEIAQDIVKRGIAEIKADLEGFDIPAAPDETTKPKPSDMVMMYAADGSYGGEFFIKELSLDTGEIKLMPYHQRQPDLGTVTDCKTDDDMGTWLDIEDELWIHPQDWQIWHEGKE